MDCDMKKVTEIAEAQAGVIKAAEALEADVMVVQAYRAQCAHGSVNLSALALKMEAVEKTLNAFHRAKQRQAAILRSYEVPANEARIDALWDVAKNDPDPNGDVTVGKRKFRTDGGEER